MSTRHQIKHYISVDPQWLVWVMSKRGVHDISLKSLCLIDKPNDVLLAFHFSLLFWIYSMTIQLEYKVWLYFCHTSIKKLSLRINRGLALDNVDVLLKIFHLKSPLWWLVFVSVGLLTLDFLNSFSAFAIVFHKMSCVFFSLFFSSCLFVWHLKGCHKVSFFVCLLTQ